MEKNKDLGAETETKEECKEKELIEKCELFKNINGEVVITSLGLSTGFKQEHKKIMQNIRKWIGEDGTLKVQSYINSQNKEQPYYELNKYQFMLYVMHIRGFEELKTKIIKDYEAMEKYIIQTNQEEQFTKYKEELNKKDEQLKEKDERIDHYKSKDKTMRKRLILKDERNYFSYKDIQELFDEDINYNWEEMCEVSRQMSLDIIKKRVWSCRQSKYININMYHFLVWCKVYGYGTSGYYEEVKNAYDELVKSDGFN